MPCPLGYVAQPEEDEAEQAIDGDASLTDEQKAAAKEANKDRFTFEKNPVNWFYKNQIQAEEEFKRKKSKQQQQYRERLERLMGAKEKHLEFDPSIDFDQLSIASSELSELDSDVHSLSSLKSCADSWILDSEYKKPAEGWIRAACLQLAWLPVAVCARQAYVVITLSKGDAAAAAAAAAESCSLSFKLTLPDLAVLSLYAVAAFAAAVAMLYFSAVKRSKRVLLLSQLALLGVYMATAAVTAYMFAIPIKGHQLVEGAMCQHEPTAKAVRACMQQLSQAASSERDLSEASSLLRWAMVALGFSCIALCSLGLWFVFELAYIEKKAAKHTRRHRHNKHHIPWHKIKIVGPMMECGAGNKQAAGAAPKGHGAGGGKCPMGFKG